MFRNYVTIAVRNLFKYKLTSFINLFSLTTGLTCCLAIIAYSINELSYDKHHKNSNRIYRVATDWKWEGGNLNMAVTSGPVALMLKQNFPEVEQTVRLFAEGTEYVKSGQNSIELSPIFSEASFFHIFDHPFLYGDANTALSEPNSLVLSESTAIKIFGNVDNAYGKTVEYINRPAQKITGIIKDVPATSHFSFNAVGVLDAKADYVNDIQNINLYTYVLLKEGANVSSFAAKIKKLMSVKMNDDKSEYNYNFQPLTSIYLAQPLGGELGAKGNLQNLYILGFVGGIILLLACINYINLATAQSTRRAKEVGVRKVVGSTRKQIIVQFFTESFLSILLAALLSLILFQLISPLLSQIGGKPISLWQSGWPNVLMIVFGLATLVGLISGLYPAVFLSKFKPVAVLKGVFSKNPSHAYFRKSLVVSQFTISIALLAFTLICWQQLSFVMEKDLGFNKEQVLGLRIANQDLRTKNLTALKATLGSYPGITATASTTNQVGNDGAIPTSGFFFESNGQKPGHTKISQKIGIDPGYFKLMEIELKKGRNFSPLIPSDTLESLIVNETLVKAEGWKNPIGKKIWFFTDDKGNTKEAKVIGVVKDFHVASLHKTIEPLLFFLAPPQESDNLYIRVKPNDIKGSLAFIQKTFREFDNYNPYQTYFLDQNFANQYKEDDQKRNLFMVFAILAITIACLGLFGLAAFTIEQRTKEIGIRKVLGAPINSILVMVTKDFVWLVLIAFVVAAPLAIWGINKWLQDFAYRVEIHWWIFAVAGLLAVIVALATVSLQALKVAMANPVKSLRTE